MKLIRELVIDKNKIHQFIKQTLSSYVVLGPVKDNNLVLFKQITNLKEITLDFTNSQLPPKSLYFPQTETLFRFTKDENIEIETPKNDNKTLIFGMRPCDAKSLKLLDQVFSGEYKDSLFLSRRKNTTLVGLTCNNPPVNCFCTSVGGSPDDTTGLDVLLTDIGEKYFVEVLTKKGKHLVESFDRFKPAKNQDKKKKAEISRKARESIQRIAKTEKIEQILDEIFENNYWAEIARKCLGCGICTFLCPTCHCFDIQDETFGKKGARVRIWDSCMYPEYSMQASGYNPRPTQMNRMRNRVYHKFNYFPKNQHVFGCVGCGRCIGECPVNIDIIEIINKAREIKNE